MNNRQVLDIKEFVQFFQLSEELKGISIIITGATGLIGSALIKCLLAIDKGVRITAPVRNREKAVRTFGLVSSCIDIIECDLVEYFTGLNDHFDYIIHCASPTSGQYMSNFPVETYDLAIESIRAILQYARRHTTKGIVYVSSLEFYGQNSNDKIITEDFQGYVDASSPRSSYPMGKRAAEYPAEA